MIKGALFAEVILPLAIKGTYTYVVDQGDREKALPGMRVLVQLGQKKIYSGIILETHRQKPGDFDAKPLLSFLDEEPLVNSLQLQFWKWLSGYYMCSIGEVMNAAMPAGLKLASETVFHLNEATEQELSEQERYFCEFLGESSSATLDDILKSPFEKEGVKIVKRLVERGVVSTGQHLKESYKPKTIACLGLHAAYKNEKKLSGFMDSLSRAPNQLQALEDYIRLSGCFEENAAPREVEKSEMLSAGAGSAAIASLIKKGVLIQYERMVSRIHHDGTGEDSSLPFQLAAFQETAMKEVRKSFKDQQVVLLHGITSSGKTELYIHLIKDQIEQGKQVLYLLPEIALTTQIIKRLKLVFGEKIGVYHSRYSDNERVEVYHNLAGFSENDEYSIILGVRSAIFLPFKNLGLIIVDEEHENTYKQSDPAPRYHARDASIILGMFSGAKVLLGSATPSFESLYNAHTGKYTLVELKQRFGDVELPGIVIADVTRAMKRKQLKSHFTPELISAMKEALEMGEQIILFQNRRGYSNYMHCDDCGSILKCGSCDVSLTYHKFSNEMVCHYCGFKLPLPSACPDCNSHAYSMRGFGTEKVEDDIKLMFPEAAVGRLDLDKIKSRKGFEKLISDFEKGRIQILVGTQLVTKGLDFENVSLVGILDADSMLNFPDFRAFERSFQLILQVSGRAGRRTKQGKVVIQTRDPEHPVIMKVLQNEFGSFFREQMDERKLFKYPPYYRLIRITLRHEIPSILDGGAIFLANEMREIFGGRVLGPQQPPIGRTHGKYIKQILLKVEKEASVEKAKNILSELMDIFSESPVYKQIRKVVDVDPL